MKSNTSYAATSVEDRMFGAALGRLTKKTKINECLVPRCTNAAIKSHSIQNSGALKGISEDGHVYMIKTKAHSPDLELKLEGRNEASTFTGLCGPHDNSLFEPIDFDHKNKFDPSDRRQLSLLVLRALLRETWTKLSVMKLTNSIARPALEGNREKLKELLGSKLRAEVLADRAETIAFPIAMAHGQSALRMMDGALRLWDQVKRGKFHYHRSEIFELPRANVVASSVFRPDFDFEGRPIKAKEFEAWVCISIFPHEDKSIVVLSFHRKFEKYYYRYFDQLKNLTQEEIARALSTTLLCYCENIAFRPSYIERLSEVERRELVELFTYTLMGLENPIESRFNFFSNGETNSVLR